MHIYVNNETNYDLEKFFGDIINACEMAAGKEFDAEIGVTFVSSDDIRVMNRDYRGKDSVTDVLSFPADTAPDGRLYGDIFICYEQAVRQAAEIGNSDRREIVFLAVHGMLHLMGYDHEDDVNENIMIKKQKEIIGGLS